MSLQSLVSDIKKKKTGSVDLSFMKNQPKAGMSMRPLPGATISKAPETRAPLTRIAEKVLPRKAFNLYEDTIAEPFAKVRKFLAPSFSDQMNIALEENPKATTAELEKRARQLDEESGMARLNNKTSLDVMGTGGSMKAIQREIFKRIAKETDRFTIAKTLKSELPDQFTDVQSLANISTKLAGVKDENEVQKIIDVAIKSKAPATSVKTMAEKMPESPLVTEATKYKTIEEELKSTNIKLSELSRRSNLTTSEKGMEKIFIERNNLESAQARLKQDLDDIGNKKLSSGITIAESNKPALGFKLVDDKGNEFVPIKELRDEKTARSSGQEYLVLDEKGNTTIRNGKNPKYAIDPDGLNIKRDPSQDGMTKYDLLERYNKKNESPTPQTNKVSAIDQKRELTQLDKLIAENKVRVVSRNGKDTYQVKQGDTWITKRDEDSALKYFEPKPKKPGIQIDPKLEERLLGARIAKEALDENPLKELSKFVAKRGEFKGQIGEATGKKVGPKDGYTFDAKVMDMGIDDTGVARAQYAQYRERVADNAVEIAEARDAIRLAKQEEKMLQEAEKAKDALIDSRYTKPATSPKEVSSLEETANQLVEDLPVSPSEKPMSLKDIVTQTPLKGKVNLLDYIRTPDRVLKKIGFEKEAQFLRNQYEEYVKELPKNIDKITAWADQVPKDAGERIFQWLDGKEVQLYGNELKVAGEIKAYLKEWADRLGLPEDNRITNYITHIFEDQLVAKEFDEDLAKIIANKIPGEVYDPFLLRRLGAQGYKQDVWASLDAYVKRATRKVHLDPALEKMQDKAGASLEFSNLEKSQFDYIKNYVDRVNLRPTDLDSLLDTGFKQIFGYSLGQRPINRLSGLMRRLTYRGMLGLNLGSALRNLSQGVNTYATLGERDTFLGYVKLFSKENRDELAREGVLDNNFIQDRALSSTKKLMEKADKGLWVFFDTAEKLNRGSAYLGAKTKGLRKGMTEKEAIEYAKTVVRKTQFNYDPVDTPVGLSSDLIKTLMQFQTYTTKQTEFLAELAHDRNFAGLARYALSGLAFVYTIGQAFGMEQKELLPVYRFDTPPSLKFPVELTKALLDAPDKYGNDRDFEQKVSDVSKTLWGVIPGGMQLKKTVQGLEANQEGGSYDASGKKQFEVGGSTLKEMQSALFGKYASKEAKDYFDKGTGDKTFDTLKEKDNEVKATERKTVKQEVDTLRGASKEEVKARLLELAKEDKKMAEKVLDGLIEDKMNLSSFEKKLKESSVNVRAEYVAENLAELETPQEKKDYILDLKEKGILTESVLDRLIELKGETP